MWFRSYRLMKSVSFRTVPIWLHHSVGYRWLTSTVCGNFQRFWYRTYLANNRITTLIWNNPGFKWKFSLLRSMSTVSRNASVSSNKNVESYHITLLKLTHHTLSCFVIKSISWHKKCGSLIMTILCEHFLKMVKIVLCNRSSSSSGRSNELKSCGFSNISVICKIVKLNVNLLPRSCRMILFGNNDFAFFNERSAES